MVEPHAFGQWSNGPGRALHVVRREVPLPEPAGDVAVLPAGFGGARRSPRQHGRVAREGPGNSAIEPKPTRWWLRPVSSAARVGEHTAVTWKRL